MALAAMERRQKFAAKAAEPLGAEMGLEFRV